MVSVIMTAYNRERYIAEAIESVLSSNFADFELLVFDDLSTDNTVSIVQNYLNDKRVKLHVNHQNLGDYGNRNFAASHASGEFIMFCDSDDKFFRDTIQYCVNAMQNNPGSGLGMYFESKENMEPFCMEPKEVFQKHFFQKAILTMGPGGTIIRTDFFKKIGGYPVKYGPANDMYFNLKVCSQTNILFLPKLFLYYREHDMQEKNKIYEYLHYNYNYLSDALAQLNMHLSNSEKKYLLNKNKRRFIANVFRRFKTNKNFKEIKYLFNKTNFGFTDLLKGLFH